FGTPPAPGRASNAGRRIPRSSPRGGRARARRAPWSSRGIRMRRLARPRGARARLPRPLARRPPSGGPASRSARRPRCRRREGAHRSARAPAARAAPLGARHSYPRPRPPPRSRFARAAGEGRSSSQGGHPPRAHGGRRSRRRPHVRAWSFRRVDYVSCMRVLIADDHPLILAGIKRALEEDDQFEVVAEARVGGQVLPLVSQTNPDLALLDLRMPEMDGLTCLDRIRKEHPKVKVVTLSAPTDPEVVQTVLNHGAAAYVVKSVNPIDLSSALRQALEGTVFSAVGLPEKTAQQDAVRAAGLTDRETTILKALARGLSNEAIGKELWVAQQTVKFHLTNIYRKLDVKNRTEAARYA